ncbi:putative pilus assembly protein PilY [Moraxella osloensis]|nr:putative pilus assembly protein PilY [Moraxella osloensis]
MSMMVAVSTSQADVSQKKIGDLEIYKAATDGQINLMMMLDTSGSMGISSLVLPKNNPYGSPGDVDTGLCDRVIVYEYNNNRSSTYPFAEWAYNARDTRDGETKGKTSFKKSVTINGTTIPYYLRGCGTASIDAAGKLVEPVDSTGRQLGAFDRLSRLKDALITLLAGTDIKNSIVMGLGQFSSKTEINISGATNKIVDGHSGRILVKAAALDQNQRIKLIQAIAGIQSLDTTTNQDGSANDALKFSSNNYPNVTKASSGTPAAHAYAEAGAYMMGTTTGKDPNPPSSVSIVYDGSMTMQNPTTKEQVYFTCVSLGGGETSIFNGNAKVKQCVNNWPGYDSSNKIITTATINRGVYMPNGNGGWTQITSLDDFKTKSGVTTMDSGWETFTKLPVGWRYGGWMKVANEPMDIEPIVGTVWTGYAGGTIGIVSYRTSPFSIKNTTTSTNGIGEPIENMYGGIAYSAADTNNGTNYYRGATPVTSTTAQCDSNGIYFLTDGAPNSTKDDMAKTILNKSLNDDTRYTIITKPTGLISPTLQSGLFSGETGGWEWIGEYAKRLRNASQNPSGISIKTAVAGFGSSFAGLDYNSDTKLYNCDTATANNDAKNACKWGQQGAGYGEGGFFYAQSSEDIANSVLSFIQNLNNTLPATPSGTIIVPDDPYRADSQLAVAYYPILQAEVGKNQAIWSGNLKKYNLNEGTLYGKSNAALFSDIAGKLNPSTEDLWSAMSITKDGAVANDIVTSGGFFSNLKTPDTAVNNIRTLYLEDKQSATNSTPVIRKFGVTSAGKLTLTNLSGTSGDAISTTNTFNDTAIYSRDKINYLLQFLGFTLTDAQKTQSLTDLVLTAPSSAVKHLGATIHSTPSMVSYSAGLDATTGAVTDTRDDYALFGSSDGMVHMVNADNYTTTGSGGRELLAFMPKLMLDKQPEALINGTSPDVGKPYFGVDAPWLVSANYFYDLDNNRVTVTPCPADTVNDPSNTRDCRNTYVRAYGGLRMGGEGMYGLDLTDKNNPKMLFRIDSATIGFDRMGQIWSKPTKAKIATGIDSTTKKVNAYQDVLVFGGGYDTCYEDQGYQVGTTTSTLSNQKSQACNRTTATESLGNAVYMVDAKTGALIWSATKAANAVSGATNTTVSTLNNSIVGGITVLDRNNDGYMDQLYFADMGGQLFRADFTNAGFIKPVSSGTAAPETSFSNTRVVRLLQPAFTGTDIKYNHRFYERPAVSFYRGDSTFNNSRLFAVVNVISGDRSSPLSKLRASDAYADRLYGIMDTDVTLADSILYADDFTTRKESTATNAAKVQKVVDLTANTTAASDLLALPTVTTDYTLATKQAAITSVKAKRGWYYPLTRFDGFNQVKYTKGVGKSEVIDSFLYTTVYNPDMNYGVTESCSAKITGGSERQLYCLPYGICLKETTDSERVVSDEYATSKNGTAGFARAGQGIQELTLGPRSSTLSNQRLLIGTQTITDRASNRVGFGDDSGKLQAGDTGSNNIGLDKTSQPLSGLSKTTGDGSAIENIYNDRYTLKPNTWFEVNK